MQLVNQSILIAGFFTLFNTLSPKSHSSFLFTSNQNHDIIKLWKQIKNYIMSQKCQTLKKSNQE